MSSTIEELMSWEVVPEQYWPGVLKRINGNNFVDSGDSFHCYNVVHRLSNYLYDVTFEYSSRTNGPCDIKRKKVD